MKRKIYQKLIEWKNSSDRKPLILQGARQVGKTYVVNLFGGNEYSNCVYCNFEKEQGLKELFEELEPELIVKKLSLYKRKEILKEHTLIIFDEIQACPLALTSLKYFNEEANEYHVISMGSLLGVSVNRESFSFPVGKVQFMDMYPMDFEEFLIANGEELLIEQIMKAYDENKMLEKPFHDRAMDYYIKYLYVGGMPEVVDEYLKTNNLEIVRIKQKTIIESYFNDMGKYNKATEIPKTKIVYKNISTQLAKENKKFQYRLVKHGGRASEFEAAIEWICLSGIANQVYKLNQIKLPLNAYQSLKDFKFYMNDVGLCCASQDIMMADIESESISFDFIGGLVENYVNNQLIVNNIKSYYWVSDYDAEVDFVTRLDKDIIPIEVKSGENVKSKSLSVYIDRFNPMYALRVSKKNFGLENNIKSVPLYAVFCIK